MELIIANDWRLITEMSTTVARTNMTNGDDDIQFEHFY